MTRYERKQFFEQLLAMRAAYGAETHEPLAMSIEDAVTFAAETFDALAATDATAGATTSSATSSTATTTGPSTAA